MFNPAFLLFDEPTSALDPENTKIFVSVIRELQKKGTGIIISSQDMMFAKNILENAFFLENGVLIESYFSEVHQNLEKAEKLKKFLSPGSSHVNL